MSEPAATHPQETAIGPPSLSPLEATRYDAEIITVTSAKIRTFLYELTEGVTNYRSLHNLTEQVEHQYHGRFLVELIQNAHDALLPISTAAPGRSRIEIRLCPDEGDYGALYVANDGRPFSQSNFKSLSQLGQSDKDPQEAIGNKGIGFRSVLEITTSPEIYSRVTSDSPLFDGFCFAFSPMILDHLFGAVLSMLKGESAGLSLLHGVPLVNWDTNLVERFRSAVRQQDESWLKQQVRYLSPYLLPFPVKPSRSLATVADLEQRGFASTIRFPIKGSKARAIVAKALGELDKSTMVCVLSASLRD